MKQLTINSLFVFLTLLFFTDESQAQFKIDAQFRNRFEFRDGYQMLLPDVAIPATFISQRTRLSFLYENEKLKIKITPQDVRIWGDEQLASSTGVFGDKASLDLYEGYVELKAGSYTWISVGRQKLVYDNQRMLAARNWKQLGISYDAVVARFQFKEWNLHITGSWNTLLENSVENLYDPDRIKSLNFLWLNRRFSNELSISLLQIASGVTQTDTTNTLNFRQTTGIYFEFKKDKLKIWGDMYYQYGKNRNGSHVSAFLTGADAIYTIGKLTPGIGFEYLSGNSKTGDDLSTDHLFDLLYGARHRYFGYMDFFRNMPSSTKQGGLIDYYIYFDLKISKSVNIQNIGHFFQLAQTNLTTPDDRNLGFENDLVLKYKFSDWGVLEGGYLFLLPTESLKTIQNVPNDKFAQFTYLQLTLTPTLFKQKDYQ